MTKWRVRCSFWLKSCVCDEVSRSLCRAGRPSGPASARAAPRAGPWTPFVGLMFAISFSKHLCSINHSDPFRVYTRHVSRPRRLPTVRRRNRCCEILLLSVSHSLSLHSLTLSVSTLSARRCPARHTRLRASTQHLRPSCRFDGRFNKPTPAETSNWRDPVQASSNDSAWLRPHRASTHGILPLAISCATVR